jgi:hypothetical protein
MQLQETLVMNRKHPPTARYSVVSKMMVTTILTGIVMAYVGDAVAACGATINGQAMTVKECRIARQIYGDVAPGDYLRDSLGNWVKVGDPNVRGNVYRDAQRAKNSSGSRHRSNGGGLTRTPFGSVGGGYFFDNETGSSVGP